MICINKDILYPMHDQHHKCQKYNERPSVMRVSEKRALLKHVKIVEFWHWQWQCLCVETV